MQSITIGNKQVGPGEDVFVIAEIGNNHEGHFAVAKQMIDVAAQTGVDAVKFQTFIPQWYVGKSDMARYNKLKQFQLSFDQFAELAEHAKKAGLIFLSTPFDLESAEFLKDIVPAFKISSGDNNFSMLLHNIACYDKPVILSTGLADYDQISNTVGEIESFWYNLDCNNPGMIILHCVAGYPVSPENANLASISVLRNLGYPIGYSDHTLGIDAAVLSVAMGACVIEKHFTLDHNYSDFRDHQISANPGEMQKLVKRVKEAKVLCGRPEKIVQPGEQGNIAAMRRSMVARINLKAGDKLTADNVDFVRPGGGIPADKWQDFMLKILKADVALGERITEDILE